MKELLLVLALLLSVAWLILRIRRDKAERAADRLPGPKKLDTTSAFHAVSLKYSSTACDAAKAMTGRRFLSGAAPRLPLPGCDAMECRCGFAHHSDRRSGKDRRNPFNPATLAGGTGTFKVERRNRRDRRRSTEIANS
ncbi:MAG: hypothetical protein ACR2RD_01545 [Woeseiaceae bacterium]